MRIAAISDALSGPLWPRTHAIGEDVLCFHGAPHHEDFYLLEEAPDGDPRIRPPADIAHDLGEARARVMVCGHSHTQRVVELPDGRIVVNDGSVGLPAYAEPLRGTTVFVQAGSPHARYAMIDVTPSAVSVSLVMVGYDWRAASARRARGRRHWSSRCGRVGCRGSRGGEGGGLPTSTFRTAGRSAARDARRR